MTPEQREEIVRVVRASLKNEGGVEGRCIEHGLDIEVLEGALTLLGKMEVDALDAGAGFLLCLAMIDYKKANKEIVL